MEKNNNSLKKTKQKNNFLDKILILFAFLLKKKTLKKIFKR